MARLTKLPTVKQLSNANNTIGNDEGSIFMLMSNKLEHSPLSKIKPYKAVFGKKKIKLHHLLQWEQVSTVKGILKK